MTRSVLSEPTPTAMVTRLREPYELQRNVEDHEGRITAQANAVLGAASGYKIARGTHQQVAAADTIATTLATVVAVIVSFRDTPTAKQQYLTATVGDQGGSPAAGSFISKTFKSDLSAADDFSDNISFYWLAIGT